MKIGDVISDVNLSDAEKELLADALEKAGKWMRFKAGSYLDFDQIALPEKAPETADDALVRLEIINTSLKRKAIIEAERKAKKAAIMKAGGQIMMAILERSLPAILAAI